MNYCYNCKNHVQVSEEKIYCKLKCQFKWQDDDCELHDLETEQNKTEENN